MDHDAIPTHSLENRPGFPTRVEHILPAPGPVVNGVHRHDFHELFFFEEGSGEHMIDLQQWNIATPCMHLVAPGQVHRLDRSADMKGSVVMFAPDAQLGHGHAARRALFARTDGACSFPLSNVQLGECTALVKLMEQELERTQGPITEVVEGFLGVLLIKCAHWTSELESDGVIGGTDPYKRFLDLLETGYLAERQVSHYADLLSMSADHLNEQVKRRSGRTASSVIQDRLLLEAKRLLLHAELSIKEVGYALNMKDPAYFTRWFHKAAGVTPGAYREAIRDKYKH
ncbi:MAG: helix-turn-helix domain-containing protein [Flavobacteriales bacterium]|nr:helix-turn-helix domain-containing protein [Flavobacteriales bacterium]